MDPHKHELWCLGLDNISHKVHSIAQVEVITRILREFVTNYLAKNGHIIQIIGKLSVNDSFHFLSVPDQGGESGLPFVYNRQASVDATGWGSSNNSNRNW